MHGEGKIGRQIDLLGRTIEERTKLTLNMRYKRRLLISYISCYIKKIPLPRSAPRVMRSGHQSIARRIEISYIIRNIEVAFVIHDVYMLDCGAIYKIFVNQFPLLPLIRDVRNEFDNR